MVWVRRKEQEGENKRKDDNWVNRKGKEMSDIDRNGKVATMSVQISEKGWDERRRGEEKSGRKRNEGREDRMKIEGKARKIDE